MQSKLQEVGNYIIEQSLGEGTTGKVKLGVHKEKKTKFAIKIINKTQFTNKPDLQRKIYREIALMRLLNHPHVLKLEEVCESPRHLYIVLEFAQHGELFDFLVSHKKLPIPMAIEFFRQIIYGLDYLHTHAICHRDLKPENILLDQFDRVKIADFGFARWLRNNVADTSCGSPHYAAPEVIRGLHYDGRLADIWSCGVILYALLIGRLPFDDSSVRNLLIKVKSGRYNMPNLPLDIQDLISRLLTVDPHERITIEKIKEHPAFHIGLPNLYIVPTPLPLPLIEGPVDINGVHHDFYSILQSIGYSSEEDINNELEKTGQTMAKVFYSMFIGLLSLHSLPWPENNFTETQINFNNIKLRTAAIPDEAFIMSPKLIEIQSPQIEQFVPQPLQLDSTPIEIQSLAQKSEWAELPIGSSNAAEEEQKLCQLPLKLPEFIGNIQHFLMGCGYNCFFPSDNQIITRKPDCGLYIIINAELQPQGLMDVTLIKSEGTSSDFTDFVSLIHNQILSMISEHF